MLHNGRAAKVTMPPDADVVVLQRVTNRYMSQSIPLMRQQGIAVVVDVDDDLTAIDPNNPAFAALHPRNEGQIGGNGQISHHSWHHLTEACKQATMVTVSAPALLPRYAAHGRGRVLYNYLAPHYYGIPHEDSDLIGWPAALMSHPNDPAATGNAIARLVNQSGARFDVCARPTGVGAAFGLPQDPPGVWTDTHLLDWPKEVARLGVGIAPLADTRFNQSKSWLKPLEMCAVGVPWVASRRPEYERLHDLGAGVLADNPRHWYRELRNLLNEADRRLELSEAGRQVAYELRLETNAWRHLEAWNDALKLQRNPRLTSPQPIDLGL